MLSPADASTVKLATHPPRTVCICGGREPTTGLWPGCVCPRWSCSLGCGMDEAARQAFRDRGYFVLKNALTTQHVAELNAAYDHMLAAGAMTGAGGKSIRSSAPASLSKGGRVAPTVPVTDRHGRQYAGRRFWTQVCVCVCVRARARACVCVCARACRRGCV